MAIYKKTTRTPGGKDHLWKWINTTSWIPCDVIEKVGEASVRIRLAGGATKVVRSRNVRTGNSPEPEKPKAAQQEKAPGGWMAKYDNY